MKHFLTIIMVVALMVSMFTLATFAAESTDEPVTLIVSSGKLEDGWTNGAQTNTTGPEIDKTLTEDGQSWVKFTYSGVAGANGGWQDGDNGVKTHFFASRTYKAAHDISELTHMVFDLYVSDPAVIENVKFQMELTSSSTADKEENNLVFTFGQFVEGGLKKGANHVEIPLDQFGKGSGTDHLPMNAEEWDFMRLYNADSFDRGNEFVMAFANFGFLTYDADVEVGESEPVVEDKPSTPAVKPAPVSPEAAALVPPVPEIEDVKPVTITVDNANAYAASVGGSDIGYAAKMVTQGIITAEDIFG